MANLRKIARRTFLGLAAATAGGFAVGYYYYQKKAPNPLLASPAEGETVFNPFVKIGTDGKIIVIAPRAEMGQGISTTLAALVAEELDVPLSTITVEHGPASAAYANLTMLAAGAPYPEFDESFGANSFRSFMGIVGTFLGIQATGGSSSTIDGFDKMRQAGAAVREVLKVAAAAKLGVPVADVTTADGKVLHSASNRLLTYAELASDAASLVPPSKPALRDPSDWKILGKPQARLDMHDKVTGAPIFGVDVMLPDMLFATVRINPNFGGTAKVLDIAEAKAVRGFIDVVEIASQTGNGFAVVASNTWAAFQAADKVKVEWGTAAAPKDSAAISAALTTALDTAPGDALRNIGDVEVTIAGAGTLVEARYDVPFLAHATMEPMNATARFKGGKLDIWSPNQAPTVVKTVCASVAGTDADKVDVHTTSMGGGFGRRGEVDFSIYATLVAMKTGGKPVKVTWSRTEDMTHDTYRPASVAHFKARLGADGLPIAMDAKVAAPSIVASVLGRTFPSIPASGTDASIVDGSYNQPYAIPNLRVSAVTVDLGIPVGFWRSVGNSNNGFFHESFIDEVAEAAKLDPLDLRLKLMAPYPAAAGAVSKVADMSNWRAPPEKGHAKGMAFTLSFGTWVAMVVEVAETSQGIRIENVWAAADIGRALDPDIVKAQIMGAAVYGLSAAMNEQITFADGKVMQTNYFDYAPMRIWQCPNFHIEILETSKHMGGAGEPGTPPAAPALANAIYRLTGKRVRTLPLSREVAFA